MKPDSLLIGILVFIVMSCNTTNNNTGMQDDCSDSQGWKEVSPDGDTIPATLKLESKNGYLTIFHKHRSLEQAYKRHSWIKTNIDYSTNLRKDYGLVDLDKYHFMVLNIIEKGSSSYIDINGYTTKLGYTTGITAIDLRDYDDNRIKGKQNVNIGIDLQDNHTSLILDDIKLVSKLTDKEKEKLIGRGLTIRDENLKPLPYHGLEALKARENILLPVVDGEEMVIFRDDATGGITTRLTATPGDDYFGEGGIWSADGAAIKFKSGRDIGGIPVCIPGEGRVIAGPAGADWRMWSPVNQEILYVMKRDGMNFSVSSWDRVSGRSQHIADFTVPEIGSYVEFKRFTPEGNIVVCFRETPHLYIIDINKKEAKYIKLPTRLKDAGFISKENIVRWANCYTFELRWKNPDTGEEGLAPSFSAGHASHGTNGMVANFGGHLNVFVPHEVGLTRTPGDLISIWANWENDIVTDYGRLTADNKYVFTNGNRGDVAKQHLMIPSDDPGAVMRVARYFTKFSWTSTTYSRPSPDYTKLIYNENAIGSTELHMVYTRRPDAPENVKLEGNILSWTAPERKKETLGYNIYGSNQSGLDFTRINKDPVEGNKIAVKGIWKFYSVTAVEHSGLESGFSQEVSRNGAKTFYFEAEEMTLTPPARRFFDGYCNNFQCVRINAESEEEKSKSGIVRLPLKNLPQDNYTIWARVKGNGEWSVNSISIPVSSDEWRWVQLTGDVLVDTDKFIDISSGDDALKLDMILFTTGDFIPGAPDPRDGKPPEQLSGLTAKVSGNQVKISWSASKAADLHHYSVYCGDSEDFVCDNATIIRSVFKNSIMDALPGSPAGLYYKVVAVDNRWNESEPVTVMVQ